jgi:integrase
MIAGLPAVEGQWWDTEVRGFIVQQRKAADGSMLKSFAFRYRFGARDPKIKIGDVSELSVDQARKIAAKHRVQVLSGIDPQAVRKAERAEAMKPTYASAVEQYLQAKAAEVRPATLRTMKLYLTGAKYFAGFNRKAIDSVSGSDIQSRLDQISTEVSAASARQAWACLNGFYVWAVRRPFGCEKNPVLNTKPPKAEKERHRALSAEELRTVWTACGDDDYGRIVRLLILTGCRREEIGGLRWSEIDLDKATLTIPAPRSKNHREHTLPLPAMVMEIIEGIGRREGCDFLFGSAGFKAWSHGKRALLEACGEMAPWRLHDLRHTLSTGLHELGTDPHIVEAVVNHVSGHKAGVAGRYNHAQYRSQMATALALWADHVRSVVTGQPAKVVPLIKAA